MITTWFYSSSTLNTKDKCFHKNRGNSACKHAEFINIWYDFARYIYGPKEHIYIIDNGSPLMFKDHAAYFKEEIEYLNLDQYNFNPNVYVHVKRFNSNLNHGAGVVRAVYEGWKLAVENKLDYFFNESDSLSLINLIEELKGYDIITTNIEHSKSPNSRGNIDCSNWGHKLYLITDHITQFSQSYGYQKLSVFDSLEQSIKINGLYNGTQNDLARGTCQYTGSIEDGPYINYYGKYKMKKLEGQVIHDVNEEKLITFLNEANKLVKSNYAEYYINNL